MKSMGAEDYVYRPWPEWRREAARKRYQARLDAGGVVRPPVEYLKVAERAVDVMDLYQGGLPGATIAAEVGTSAGTVYIYLRDHAVIMTRQARCARCRRDFIIRGAAKEFKLCYECRLKHKMAKASVGRREAFTHGN